MVLPTKAVTRHIGIMQQMMTPNQPRRHRALASICIPKEAMVSLWLQKKKLKCLFPGGCFPSTSGQSTLLCHHVTVQIFKISPLLCMSSLLVYLSKVANPKNLFHQESRLFTHLPGELCCLVRFGLSSCVCSSLPLFWPQLLSSSPPLFLSLLAVCLLTRGVFVSSPVCLLLCY